jgi:adenosylhomocysteine nucleosidase
MPIEFSHLRRPRDEIRCVANGAGAHRAAAGIDEALPKFRPDAMISMGFCGALDPALRIGSIVVATTVFAEDRAFPAEPPITNLPHVSGPVRTAGRVVGTAAEKAALHATGLLAVEMEAAGVAERARKLGVPFFCIKSVTDLAGETMANDFNAVLRSDGRFDTIKLLASSLRHPWARFPELFRLQRRCVLAARSLGEFIDDCRF